MPQPADNDSAASHDVWEPPVELRWHQRWMRGWRLVLVLLLFAAGYGVWRGRDDYRSLKALRARQLAHQALDPAEQKSEEEAIALLDQAGTLAPNDPVVLKAIADFNEPRQDPMALYALRQLVNLGEATPSDQDRLCRLAFAWGHPELAPEETLKTWAESAPDALDASRLDLSGRWLASRGKMQEAIERLNLAIAKATPEEAPEMQLVLSRLEITATSNTELVGNAIGRVFTILDNKAAPAKVHREAALFLIQVLAQPAAKRFATTERTTLLRQTIAEMEKAPDLKPEEAFAVRLAGIGFEMALRPDERGAIAGALAAAAKDLPDTLRLAGCKWLNQRGFFDSVTSLTESEPLVTTQREWCMVRLDALFGLKRWQDAEDLLNVRNSPIPGLVRALFSYRIALASGRPPDELEALSTAVHSGAPHAEANDVLFAAGNFERLGDFSNATKLYRLLQNHPRAALPARLGLVRCLDQQPDQIVALRGALESLLKLWPKSEDARNDLIYLKLLDDSATQADREAAAAALKQSGHFLARRVTAAVAALREGKHKEALDLLEVPDVNWTQVRPGWLAIYAATLAANGRNEAARDAAASLNPARLRPGEAELLAKFVRSAP
ncbi:MAG: hypothetical protein KA004_18630 [Verrucomicrobiales bacterium]|nr:hypothetical protein [Verrucomicrobiales bacterium]